LAEEVGVYTGIDQPENGEKTWLETVSTEQEILEWSTIVSNPLIKLAEVHSISLPLIAPIRLVVSGLIFGEVVVQEIQSGSNPNILSGEVVLFVDDDALNTVSVSIEAALSTTSIIITNFTNTGATLITQFTGLRFEVYN
jgi:hypothetical protein